MPNPQPILKPHANPMWFETHGQPLVFLPERWLGYWCGTEGSYKFGGFEPAGKSNDYAEACAVGGCAGQIHVNGQPALAIHDPGTLAVWTPAEGVYGGALTLWRSWTTGDELDQTPMYLDALDPQRWQELDARMGFTDAVYLLFPAALSGDDQRFERRKVTFVPGEYGVRVQTYRDASCEARVYQIYLLNRIQ